MSGSYPQVGTVPGSYSEVGTVPGSYSEVGTVPGTYRIIDLYCLKDILNQIMRCSCESDSGFSIHQVEQEHLHFSFHCILDIMCKHCKQKISFGTSMILNKMNQLESEPYVDLKMNKILEDVEYRRLFRTELYGPSTNYETENNRFLPEVLNPAESLDPTDFVENPQDPELVIIFGSDGFKLSSRQEERKPAEKNQFECDICLKLFSRQYNLNQHRRTHTGEKMNCTVTGCHRTFNDKSSLNKHLKEVHLKERPIACDKCGKTFTRAAHLQEHMAVHTKEKNFKCPLCLKEFPFMSSLRNHRLTHTSEKHFKCDFCGKLFKGKKFLIGHLLNIHNYTGLDQFTQHGLQSNQQFVN